MLVTTYWYSNCNCNWSSAVSLTLEVGVGQLNRLKTATGDQQLFELRLFSEHTFFLIILTQTTLLHLLLS
jgi:hypothetical protein